MKSSKDYFSQWENEYKDPFKKEESFGIQPDYDRFSHESFLDIIREQQSPTTPTRTPTPTTSKSTPLRQDNLASERMAFNKANQESYKKEPDYDNLLKSGVIKSIEEFKKGRRVAEHYNTGFLDYIPEFNPGGQIIEGLRDVTNVIARNLGATGDVWELSDFDKGYNQRVAELYEQRSRAGKIGHDFMRGLESFAAGATTASPAFNLAALSTIAGGTGGQQALDEGATPFQSLTQGTVEGVAEGLLEKKLGIIPGAGQTVSGLSGIARKNIIPIAKQFIKNALGEGAEETLANVISGVTKYNLGYKPDMPVFGTGGAIDPKQALYEGFIGTLLGGVVSGSNVVNDINTAKAVQQEISTNFSTDVRTGLSMPQNTQSYKMAQDIGAKGLNVKLEDYEKFVDQLRRDMPKYNQVQQQDTRPQLRSMAGQDATFYRRGQSTPFTPQQQPQVARRQLESDSLTEGEITLPPQETAVKQQPIEDIADRNMNNVRGYKAYQYEHPEFKPYYQDYARDILDNEYVRAKPGWDGEVERSMQTEITKKLKEMVGSYEDIEKGLNAIIKDEGAENIGPAKRVEFVIDDILTNGYNSIYGYDVPPNKPYIELKNQLTGKNIPTEKTSMIESLQEFETTNEPQYAQPVQQPTQKESDAKQPQGVKQEQQQIQPKEQQQEQQQEQPQEQLTQKVNKALKDLTSMTSEGKSISPNNNNGIKSEPKVKRKSKTTKVEELPDTVEKLEEEIKNMKEDIENSKKGLILLSFDLQHFAEAENKLKTLKAISKFYANTLKSINEYSDIERDMFETADGEYNVVSEKESLEKAQERLSRDFDGEVNNLRKNGLQNGVDVDVAMGILEVYRNEGRNTGDYSKMKEWAKVIRSKGATTMGQGIQAFAKYSRTPEHFINEAERIIDDVEEQTEKDNKEIIDNIDNETKVVDEVLKEADKKAGEETSKEVEREEKKEQKKQSQNSKGSKKSKKRGEEKKEDDPAELLANRIKAAVKGPKAKEKDVVMQMVNELYQKFRETDIDGNLPKRLKPDKIQEFIEAIKNKDVSDNVWIKAKEIVREHFKDDVVALDMIDNYFGKGTRPPFSEKTAEEAIKKVMKKLDYKLSDIVKDYYATGEQQRTNILEYMKTEGRLQELTDDEINVLANYVDAKFKTWKKEFADAYLKSVYKIKSTNKSDIERNTLRFIDSAVNTGIFLNQNYSNRVNEKLDPKIRTLIRTSGVKIYELVKKGKDSVTFERDSFIKALKANVRISQEDAIKVSMIAERVFNEEVEKARQSILKGMLKSNKAKRRKRVFDKVLELINLDAYSISAIRDIIKEKEGLPVLTNQDIELIIDAVETRNMVEQDSYLYRLMTNKIELIMSNKIPPTKIDKVRGLQRIWLLLNPKTNIRNITGNIILTGTENIKDLVAAPIDLILARIRGVERTTLFNPIEKIKWQHEGAKLGLIENTLDLRNSFDTGFSKDMSWKEIYNNLMSIQAVTTSYMGERYELRKGRIFDSDMLNFLDNSVKIILKFGDRPFFEAAYNMRLKELMKIKGLAEKNPDVDMLAKLYALERVFQNDSQLSKRLTIIRNALGIPGIIVFPFTQTPANVYDKLLDYTPVGFAKAMYEIGKLNSNAKIRKYIKGEFDQKVFVDRMARSFTGTGLMLIGGIMAALGLASGGDDKRKKVRAHEKTTKQAYSFKIGGKWYSYEQLQPIGGVFAMGVEWHNKSKDKKGFLNSIGAGFDAAGNTFIRASFMRNAIDVIGAVAGSNGSINRALTKLFSNASSQTNPTFIRQISDLSDDFVRETYDPSPIKQFINRYISKIPLVSNYLPKKVDVYGSEIKRYDDANNVLNVMFNPLFIKDIKPTPLQKEISYVFSKTNNTDILPRVTDDTITVTIEGKTHTLTLDVQQYINYQKLSGKLLTYAANIMINSDEYKSLNGLPYEYEIKAKLFSDIMNEAHKVARLTVIEQYIEDKKLEESNKK